MKRRTQTDDTLQKMASVRALKRSRSSRAFDPARLKKKHKVLGRCIVVAPAQLSFFSDNYSVFVAFIDELMQVGSESRVLIDLRNVRQVKAAAVLLLYAVVENLQRKFGGKSRVKTTRCQSRYISQSLARFGFWELTGEARHRAPYIGPGLDVCSASYANQQAGDDSELRRAVKYVQHAIVHSGIDPEQGVKAFAAITESFSNVWQHAYDDAFYPVALPDNEKNWWIAVENIDDQLFIAVYDSGVGIPKTLSKKPWYSELVSELLGLLGVSDHSDGLAIHAAVEYGNSRFKEGGRGKGLAEMKDFVSANPSGNIVIYSGTGLYEYRSGRIETTESLPMAMPGTLIQWNIQLGSAS